MLRHLRWRAHNRRRHWNGIVEVEGGVRQTIIKIRCVAANVLRHVRQIECVDLFAPVVQVVSHPNVIIRSAKERRAQRCFDAPNRCLLLLPLHLVHCVLLRLHRHAPWRACAARKCDFRRTVLS